MRVSLTTVAGLLLGLALTAPRSESCYFGSPLSRTTLDQECREAQVILWATVVDADADAKTSTLRIDETLKGRSLLGGAKVITVRQYVPTPDSNNPPRMLILGEVVKGELDFYMGKSGRSAALAEYARAALALDPADRKGRLMFFFRHLEHDEAAVAEDAYLEFAKADEKDLIAVAPKLDPEKLRTWLAATRTPASRLDLYGLLLGGCGTANDVELLRSAMDRATGSAMHGPLTGFVLLQPKEGWKHVRSLLADGETNFMERYKALRSVRYFFEHRPDVIPRKQAVEAVCLLLGQDDICDLAIEDLRRWQRWERAAEVVALKDLPTHQAPIVRRALIRYALSCPAEQEQAGALIGEMRAKSPKLVDEAEELLKLEKDK
jgi:hypothetical protein